MRPACQCAATTSNIPSRHRSSSQKAKGHVQFAGRALLTKAQRRVLQCIRCTCPESPALRAFRALFSLGTGEALSMFCAWLFTTVGAAVYKGSWTRFRTFFLACVKNLRVNGFGRRKCVQSTVLSIPAGTHQQYANVSASRCRFQRPILRTVSSTTQAQRAKMYIDTSTPAKLAHIALLSQDWHVGWYRMQTTNHPPGSVKWSSPCGV